MRAATMPTTPGFLPGQHLIDGYGGFGFRFADLYETGYGRPAILIYWARDPSWLLYDAEFRSLLLDADRAGTVAHALTGLWDALAGVRDQLSSDIWRVFGATDRAAEALRANPHSCCAGASCPRPRACLPAKRLRCWTRSTTKSSRWTRPACRSKS